MTWRTLFALVLAWYAGTLYGRAEARGECVEVEFPHGLLDAPSVPQDEGIEL